MHADISFFTYCVLTVSLSKSIIIFIYGKHLILPAQGTNTKDGIRALTITTINFIMVALPPPTWKFFIFSFSLALLLCMPKCQPKQKSCSSCISKDAYPKNIPQNSRTTSVQFTWAYVVTIHSTVCKSHYEPTVNAQRCVSSALSKYSKPFRN